MCFSLGSSIVALCIGWSSAAFVLVRRGHRAAALRAFLVGSIQLGDIIFWLDLHVSRNPDGGARSWFDVSSAVQTDAQSCSLANRGGSSMIWLLLLSHLIAEPVIFSTQKAIVYVGAGFVVLVALSFWDWPWACSRLVQPTSWFMHDVLGLGDRVFVQWFSKDLPWASIVFYHLGFVTAESGPSTYPTSYDDDEAEVIAALRGQYVKTIADWRLVRLFLRNPDALKHYSVICTRGACGPYHLVHCGDACGKVVHLFSFKVSDSIGFLVLLVSRWLCPEYSGSFYCIYGSCIYCPFYIALRNAPRRNHRRVHDAVRAPDMARPSDVERESQKVQSSMMRDLPLRAAGMPEDGGAMEQTPKPIVEVESQTVQSSMMCDLPVAWGS